jgi:C4-dicarboxylate-specific signal transduction histidine kinase
VLAITRKLGDFSRVGADAPAPVAIDTAMESALALLRYSAQAPEVEVTYRGASGASVLARAGQLEQVIFNILLNAAQAMRGRGRVEADAVIHQGDLTLSIRDTGPGIAAEHLAHVFDPFFTTKPPGEGTGLGLAISYEIAHELGGALRASNREEGGALFETTLPLWRG